MREISYFSALYDFIKYPISGEEEFGLRNAQLGAIHAIAANDTLEENGNSMIVMPTGSGKTTVLMMAPYILRKSKVLIVTPSALVRGQIYDDYSKLKTLKRIGVFSKEIVAPRIFEAKKLYADNQLDDIREADVVIATHKVAVSISSENISKSFDYIIIDEAHHVPAPSWQSILTNMPNISSLFVTATPFRLDRKDINGKQIYNYPLYKAYRDGIFGEIVFHPIEEAPEKDRLIALEAERVFLNDREIGLDHYMMVRTDTKEKARLLEILYKESTSLRLKRIDSSMTYKTVNQALNDLKSKKLDGIICVDMLGEGFDFPNLKIAAVHEPQKSLASTLQFIGRFARTNAENIGSAKFIAMKDENLRIGNKKLYSSDIAWQEMIMNISDETIEGEYQSQSILNDFTKPDLKGQAIPIANIRPNFHAKVYEVNDFDINSSLPEMLGIDDEIYKNYENNTIVGISKIYTVPLWYDGEMPINKELGLYIVHYQEQTKLLFIYAHSKTEATYESIAECFSSSFDKIPRNEIHRVLAGLENYEFFNTGMQNRYTENGESYRIYAGSNTASSIDENTGRMLSAGHAFCKARKNGEEITIGYSSGSKIWSQIYLNIPEYISLCDKLGLKISNNSLRVRTNTNYDKLPLAERITKFESDVIFAFLSDDCFSSPGIIFSSNQEEKALITDVELEVVSVSDLSISFKVKIFGEEEQLQCNIQGIYKSSKSIFMCLDGKETYSLEEYFTEHPITFKTTRDTVYTGNEVLKGNVELEKFDMTRVEVIDWDSLSVDTNLEFGESKDSSKISIQEGLKQYLVDSGSSTHIFYDHGSGEVADFITFNEDVSHININLYHCKSRSGKRFNSNLEDVYEVAQQAVKCTKWLKNKVELQNKIDERNRNTRNSTFITGDFTSFKELMRVNKPMNVTVYIVQPGVSISKPMKEEYGTILSSANYFIRNSGRVKKLKILGSS
ncbi:DEAD/DEAH box helicase family protein [Peptoniphilus sp. KCTC 25270]|uniref:DEAD/DEAH box helicase n=1 Tax=Peptoniphilus sp. KCTC 25270 TaxID=2897414 RepID=UPI001E45DF53|nr:DEAD/DEAH box helicase family protein [Peptoniphilus sp. KCTC 25270]